MATMSVLIGGGGIAGLALAIGLRRHGVQVTVVERADRPIRSGGGLVLAPNAVKALAAIDPDVTSQVRAIGRVAGARGVTGHRTPFLDQHGRPLGAVSFDGFEDRWGAPAVAVLWADLHRLLLDAATACGAAILAGHRVECFVDRGSHVELTANADVLHGDALVGADGIGSVVRETLLGDGEPAHSGLTAVRGIGPAPGDHPDGFIAYGRGCVLFVAAIGDGRVYWVASMTAGPGTWPPLAPEVALTRVLDRMAGWAPTLRTVVAEARPADCVVTDVFDRAPTGDWSRGRVALMGDAAHPMVYTLGQGAGMALEDATVLGARLAGADDVPAALAGYVAERARRVRSVVRQSRLLGRIGHVRSPLAAALRNAILSAVTRFGDADRQNATLFAWQPPDAPVRR